MTKIQTGQTAYDRRSLIFTQKNDTILLFPRQFISVVAQNHRVITCYDVLFSLSVRRLLMCNSEGGGRGG